VKLRQLFEAHHKATAAFCFGRFNPPHQGHMEVWNAVKHAGHKWFIGTNPGTIGPNDPLPYDLKTAWMTAIDPQIKGHILGEQSVVTLAAKIYQQVGDGATIAYVTDSQDWAWAGKLLHQYNGKESTHGYFNFAKIIHVESPRVSSATALRTAARAGDMKAFYQAAGTDPDLAVNGQHYYDTVVAAVGQHPEKVKKVKKEKPVIEPAAEGLMSLLAKQAPKVVKKPSTSLADVRAAVARDKELSDALPPPHIRMYLQRIKDANSKGVQPQFSSSEYASLEQWIKQQQIYKENSIKYANKIIREMRAHQFIKESGTHKIDDTHKAAIKNATTYPSMNQSTGSAYLGWRMGVALAGAPDYPTKQAADNWIGGDPLLSPYTEEENEMINAAAKQVGGGKRQTWSSNRSLETADTNKTSAVAKPKKNRYGV
jgi:hypothetical protein